MALHRLRVGVAGLGRMGKRHALIFLNQVPRAELVAVSSPDVKEREWAAENLAQHGVTVYEHFPDMLAHDSLEAVCIASATSAHADQSKEAIASGKHVLCEKPLSTTVEASQSVVDAALKRPDLQVVCGFSRRSDESYRDAHRKVQEGLIGTPTVMRCQSCDILDPTGAFVSYAAVSGGVFPDASIHDIDLAIWFFGKDAKIKSVHAIGTAACYRELRQYGDADNAIGMLEFHDGRMVSLFVSRTMSGGAEDSTEIIGTTGKLVVNQVPRTNSVQLYQAGGVFHQMPQNYWKRFHNAFVVQANDFTASIMDKGPPLIELTSAVEVVKIGVALQESMRTGWKICFDEHGTRIDQAHL
ncbi:hypothetical protein CkaCkLH20_09529 [Colletotrichum karsti]|uniref:Scyllo-inositol 2-dehydrogenase n=1 Tax=Colletotrichum karsti TaxID=1095194 RepID=A0A9P6HYQ1_9PEZI|nr:uncharacterized protein CkaCkLH20_09529 [Colletotrichum karsti]KAF9873019.1 hypothetical protein CkaCkLH20_09529 [Colletotrichum karsti]